MFGYPYGPYYVAYRPPNYTPSFPYGSSYPVNPLPLYSTPYLYQHYFSNTLNDSDFTLIVAPTCESAALINAAMDYIEKVGGEYGAGFPNFEEGRRANGDLVYGIVHLRPNAFIQHHAAISEFGNVDRTNVTEMMKAAHEYSKSKGYETGIPTFHKSATHYGVLSLKPDAVEQKNILASALGNPNPENVREFFNAANRYALQNGYAAAFPTFVQVIEPGRILHHKIAFIKRGYADIRNVLAQQLDIRRHLLALGCPVPPPPRKQLLPKTPRIPIPNAPPGFTTSAEVWTDEIDVDVFYYGVRVGGGKITQASGNSAEVKVEPGIGQLYKFVFVRDGNQLKVYGEYRLHGRVVARYPVTTLISW